MKKMIIRGDPTNRMIRGHPTKSMISAHPTKANINEKIMATLFTG